ncbi:ADAMTS-like protein 4, partial [Armadillidium vulgare]
VCQLRDCNSDPAWSVQSWSACSSQCGLGTRKRLVKCTTIEGEMCDMGSCATDTWFFSPWEPSCRGPCGEGVQRRRIYCSGDPLDGKGSSSCSAKAKPSDTRNCSNEKQCHGSWFAGNLSYT